jgi:hypothetical protein
LKTGFVDSVEVLRLSGFCLWNVNSFDLPNNGKFRTTFCWNPRLIGCTKQTPD